MGLPDLVIKRPTSHARSPSLGSYPRLPATSRVRRGRSTAVQRSKFKVQGLGRKLPISWPIVRLRHLNEVSTVAELRSDFERLNLELRRQATVLLLPRGFVRLRALLSLCLLRSTAQPFTASMPCASTW